MNLRTLRIRLTVVYGLLSAIAIGALAWVAVDTGRSRIFDSAEREALALARDVADGEDAANAWWVSVEEEPGFEGAVADFWIEPPLQTITKNALWNGQMTSRFDDDTGSYLAGVQEVAEDQAFVVFIDRESFDNDANSLRLRIVLAAIGAVAAVSVVGWVVAGRSIRPTRHVLAQQRDFIADAAHELRTPLAVIQASATQTLSRERDTAAYRSSLIEIADAADRASVGVNELLDFARLEAGQALPRLAPLRLDLLAEETAASVRDDDSTVTASEGGVVVVDADYSLLRQAMQTVVHNAVERAANVTIDVDTSGRFGRIVVTDDGPGFGDVDLAHVFDRFHRGDRRGSTGLGMAIAKKIVEAHSGSIEASNRPGGGAMVMITVPLARAVDR